MRRVILESPYFGDVKMNEIYGEFCMYDCLINYNESPYASHLLYTRKYVLDDNSKKQRILGIYAGFRWRNVAHKTVFYCDLGMTEGMKFGMKDANKNRCKYELRYLPDELWIKFIEALNDEKIENIPERIKKGNI